MGNGTPVLGRTVAAVLLAAWVALTCVSVTGADTTDWRARFRHEHALAQRLRVAGHGHELRARRRLRLYHQEHAVASRLGRRVRALREHVRELRVELEHARHVQAHAAEAPAPAVDDAWACIHSHEGAWDDPNPPYWGGLQMDWNFMQTYGPEFLSRWGTADRWPVWAQVEAARRARDGYNGIPGRGYTPWPNTARMCGLD